MAWTTPKTWVVDEVVTAANMNTHLRDNLLAVVPVGVMLPYSASSAPNSMYLMCDGSAVSRATYLALFILITTTYGPGNGSTTFNLPDMRGRVVVGVNASGPTEHAALGRDDGQAVASRSAKHHHTYERADVAVNLGSSGGGNPFHQRTTTDTSGSGLQDAPSFLTLNWIIKALES